MKPSKRGYVGGPAPWLRRPQTRSAYPVGNSRQEDGTGEFTDEPTLGIPRNRIPAADTHDISSRVTNSQGPHGYLD